MATTKPTFRAVACLLAIVFLMTLHCTKAQSPEAAPAPVSVSVPTPVSEPPYEMSPAPAPGLDCSTYFFNLSDCLTFVEAGSKLAKPDRGCCPELAGLVDSQPICLCQLLGNTGNLPIEIDLNKALKLPTLCGVQTPPVDTCSAFGYPISLPPTEGPAPSPEGPAPSPEGGTAGSPDAGDNTRNGAPRMAATDDLSFFLLGLAIAIFTAVFF